MSRALTCTKLHIRNFTNLLIHSSTLELNFYMKFSRTNVIYDFTLSNENEHSIGNSKEIFGRNGSVLQDFPIKSAFYEVSRYTANDRKITPGL